MAVLSADPTEPTTGPTTTTPAAATAEPPATSSGAAGETTAAAPGAATPPSAPTAPPATPPATTPATPSTAAAPGQLVANNDAVSEPANTQTTIAASQLLGNDQPPAAGDTLHLVSVSGAAHATVALTSQGDVSFTPEAGFAGDTAFTYTVADQQFGQQATARVQVTVTAPAAPTAGPDTVYVPAGQTTTVPAAQILANDQPATPGGTLHITAVSAAQNGSAALVANGNAIFTPNANFTGAGSFGYTVADPSGATASSTVTVNVTPVVPPVSTNPLTFQTAFNQPLVVNADQIMGNVSYSPVTQSGSTVVSPPILVEVPTHGTVNLNTANGQITFTPDQNFVGTASFGWIYNNPHPGLPTPVQVQVAPPPAPTAGNDTAAATQNTSLVLPASQLLANDHASVPNDSLHISAVAAAQHAAVALTPQGDVGFTPESGFTGIATFNYTVADQYGSTATAAVAVSVQPAPQPQPPAGPQIIQQISATQVIQQIQQVEINQIQQIAIGPITIVIQPPIQPTPTATSQPLVYFDATSQAFGSELWSYDGHTVGQAADINPGSASSFPAEMQAIGGLLYFAADDGSHGRQPWTFDGQHAQMLADINPAGSSDPQDFTRLGGSVFFSATDGTDGRQLWVANGSGVHMATDISPGGAGANPANLTPVGDTLYFTATDAQHGAQLWQIATGGRPVEVTDLNPGPAGAQPDALTPVGNTLYFIADDGINGRQLYMLTANGTAVEQIVHGGSAGAFPAAGSDHALLAVGSSDLYFVANGPNGTPTLWHEHAGGPTLAVTSLANLTGPLASVQAAAAGQDLYFAVTDTHGNSELARYDTASGQLTSNIAPDLHGAPADLTAIGSTLFFTVLNHASQGDVQFRDLYADNGQTVQKVQLGGQQTLPHDLTAAQGQLYFADHGQLETVNPHGPLAAATLTVPDGHVYVPLDITPAPHEIPLLV